MIKNKKDKFDVRWEIRNKGNWNFRNSNDISMNTKPIAVVFLDGDEFVWQHNDIMELIRAYHQADKQSIHMIKTGNAGSVKSFETPLLDKILKFIRELKDEDAQICKHPCQKHQETGQKALRVD